VITKRSAHPRSDVYTHNCRELPAGRREQPPTTTESCWRHRRLTWHVEMSPGQHVEQDQQ